MCNPRFDISFKIGLITPGPLSYFIVIGWFFKFFFCHKVVL